MKYFRNRVLVVSVDGTLVTQVADLRLVYSNGSLMFPSFPAERYRHDVHTATYRCRVRNQVGVVVSRDVHVRAGIKPFNFVLFLRFHSQIRYYYWEIQNRDKGICCTFIYNRCHMCQLHAQLDPGHYLISVYSKSEV